MLSPDKLCNRFFIQNKKLWISPPSLILTAHSAEIEKQLKSFTRAVVSSRSREEVAKKKKKPLYVLLQYILHMHEHHSKNTKLVEVEL